MLRLATALLAVATACTPVAPAPTPSTGAQQAQLQIISKGGPAATVRINGAEAVRVPCNGGAALIPGDRRLPALPWDVQVVDQSRARILLEERVTELPRWLLIQRDSAGLSNSAISGPFVPCNP